MKTGTTWLNGKTIDYTYEGGWRFKVKFYDNLVAYQFIGEGTGDVSGSNTDIPYLARAIQSDLFHVMWHETDIHDLVSLVIDKKEMRIYSAALLGYQQDAMPHFESGVIHSITNS